MDIEALITKYQITDAGDGTIAVYGPVCSEEELAVLARSKEQILTLLRSKNAGANVQDPACQYSQMDQIPGLQELRRSDETHRAELVRQYPDAAFALKVEAGQRDPNYDLAVISYRAYKEILSGADISCVRLRYDKDCAEYLNKIMWA